MSTISLRTYNREIESMIDQGRVDEAVDHARHILRKFPKVIDTYRLLGKAYLEKNRNNDAADIFQRVLSAVPDDFVAHIGMSLIREEEGNLTSAVQHMERAFEKQPYNDAIQEELKRLYGKRDGIEPPKVRLTQGALARMYLKGDLQQQGISELRSALADSPDRFDLKTLLAEAYADADQMAKAIDISSDILKKFPYNLTANRILAKTLKTHDHPQEMAICRKRLYALSPYEAYVSDHAPTVEEVPDRAVTLERLDWSEDQQSFPTRTREETSPWTAPDDQLEAPQPEPKADMPDWLDPEAPLEEESIQSPEKESQPEMEPSSSSSSGPEGEEALPDWMEEAGWSEAEQISDAQERGFQDLPEAAQDQDKEEELAPADIPDWLMEKSPQGKQTEGTVPPSPEESEDLEAFALEDEDQVQDPEKLTEPQLDVSPAGDTASEDVEKDSEPTFHTPEEQEIQPSDDDLPGWLKDLKSDEDDQETAIAWLKDMPENFLEEQGPPPHPDPDPGAPVSDADEPDWIKEMLAEDTAQGSPPPRAEETQDEGEDAVPGSEGTPTEEGDLPAWLSELQTQPTSESAEMDQESPQEDLPSAAEEPESEEPEFEDEQLSWSPGFEMLDEAEDQPEKEFSDSEELTSVPGSDQADRAEGESEVPDWLSDWETAETEEQTSDTDAPLSGEPKAADVDEEQPTAAPAQPSRHSPAAGQSTPDDDTPDWLKDFEQLEAEPPEVPADQEAVPDVSSADDRADAEQGKDDFLEEGESPAGDLPDWLAKLEADGEPPEETVAPEELEKDQPPGEETRAPAPEPADLGGEEVPDWLAELEPSESPDESEDLDQVSIPEEEKAGPEGLIQEPDLEDEEEDAPDWLKSLETEAAPEESAADIEPHQAETTSPSPAEAELFGDSQTAEAPEEAQQDDLPDGMEGEVAPQAESPTSHQPDLNDEEDSMAWLESLAAKQGAQEEDLVTSPEERAQAQPPDIAEPDTSEIAEEPEEPAADLAGEIAPEGTPSEPEAEKADLPDWLAELQEEAPAEEGPDEEEEISLTEEPVSPTLDKVEPAQPEDEAAEFEAGEEADALPDWLSSLEDDEEESREAEEQPPFADQGTSPPAPSEIESPAEGPTLGTPPEDELAEWEEEVDEEEIDQDQFSEWLDSVSQEAEPEQAAPPAAPESPAETPPEDPETSEAEVETPEISEEPPSPTPDAVPPEPEFAAEEETAAEEEALPDWLTELQSEEDQLTSPEETPRQPVEEGIRSEKPLTLSEEEQPAPSTAQPKPGLETPEPETTAPAGEQSAEEAEEPTPEAEQPAGETEEFPTDLEEQLAAPEEEAPPEEETASPAVSGGMLEHLRKSEPREDTEDLPEWIQDLEEEEDPQETAILWLQKFIEKGDQVDLQAEIQSYTDNLKPDEELPEWMDDLQEEEDPQTTAMLWLEKLEQDRKRSQRSQPGRPDTEDLEDTDWLTELEREERVQQGTAGQKDDLDLDDRGWLAALEREQQVQDEKEDGKEHEAAEGEDEGDEETPPWMKATSPLEGDFLTSELESELQQEEIQEEIPDWLAGYEDEEDLILEAEDDAQPEEPEAEAKGTPPQAPPEDDYTWVPGSEPEPEAEGDQILQDIPSKSTEPPEDRPEVPSRKKDKIDLNRAGISDLESILGVGFQTARGVVTYRESHGPFTSLDQLEDVPEIADQTTLETLRREVRIEESAPEAPEAPEPTPVTEIKSETKPESPPQIEDSSQETLSQAQKYLDREDLDLALENYSHLIEKKEHLDQVIEDLNTASLEHPVNVQIIKTLGDAYMRMDNLQEALDAYSKAEDLLR